MGPLCSSPLRPAGLAGQTPAFRPSLHSSLLLPLQNNILVVKDDSNHPMSVVSSTKSRWVMQGDSCYRAGIGVPPASTSICGGT